MRHVEQQCRAVLPRRCSVFLASDSEEVGGPLAILNVSSGASCRVSELMHASCMPAPRSKTSCLAFLGFEPGVWFARYLHVHHSAAIEICVAVTASPHGAKLLQAHDVQVCRSSEVGSGSVSQISVG